MKNACVILHSYYPTDPRMRREVEALVDQGWSVDVFCLRNSGEPAHEVCSGAHVYRQPVRRHRGSGLAVYLAEYLAFCLLALVKVGWAHIWRRYAIVHVQNLPDWLVFAALVPKLCGVPIVFDIRDLVPELYAAKYPGQPNHPMVRLMVRAEQASTRFASHVTTATEACYRRLAERGVPAEKLTVVLNTADPRIFRPVAAPVVQFAGKPHFTLMYHGGLSDRYGVDYAIRAVDKLRTAIPGIRLLVFGEGEAEQGWKQLAQTLGLEAQVQFGGFVAQDRIPGLIAQADMGVAPYCKNPITDLLYPTKAFEYLTLGVPVVMSRIDAVEELFGDTPDLLVAPEDVDVLAERILTLYNDPARTQRALDAARRTCSPLNWEQQRHIYLDLIDRLALNRRRAKLA